VRCGDTVIFRGGFAPGKSRFLQKTENIEEILKKYAKVICKM